MATDLGIRPLVFDPTASNPTSGDEVTIGTITFSRDENNLLVNYQIDASYQLQYDLNSVHTRVNRGTAGNLETTGLPPNTESYLHTISVSPDVVVASIEACAETDKRDLDKLEQLLPIHGTASSTAGSYASPRGFFDTMFQPGRVPTASDFLANTVTFAASESSWETGQAIRAVAGYGSGLVPDSTNTTAGTESLTFGIPHGLTTGQSVRVASSGGGLVSTSTYYARSISSNTISLYNTAAAAANGDTTGQVNLTGAISSVIYGTSTTGLVRTPVNNLTTASQSFFARNLGGNQYLFYDTYANAMAGGATGIRDITATVPTDGSLVFVGENESLYYLGQAPVMDARMPSATDIVGDTISFTTDPNWADGTLIRVDRSSGGLQANVNHYVFKTPTGAYSLYDTAAHALAGGLAGRRNITAPVSAMAFDQVNSLTFPQPHQWTTGTVVRPSAVSGNLSVGTNYFVRVIDDYSVSLHTTLAAATANLNPIFFTAPITSTFSPLFAGWCLDTDRAMPVTAELTVKAYSSYDLDALQDTSRDPKNLFPNENGLTTQNVGLVPLSTDVVNDTVTFTSAHNLVTGVAVRVTADSNALLSTTTYFARPVNATTIAFYDTLAHASTGGAIGRVNLTGSVSSSIAVFRTSQIDFAVNHGWTTGTKVRVDAAGGGLITGADYFVNVIDFNSISLHPTLASALGNTSVVPLTGPLATATKVYVQETVVEKPENLDVMNWVLNQNYLDQLAPSQTVRATTLANGNVQPISTSFLNTGLVPKSTNVAAGVETVTFSTPHPFSNGEPVRVTNTVGGLTIGVTYYARYVNATTIKFYDTAANATGVNGVGLRNLTASITAGVFSANLGSTHDSVTFPSGHGFQSGDEVTVTATGGGLTAGTSYYLYNISGDVFSIHTGVPNADNKVNLTAAITARFIGDAVSVPASGWLTKMKVQMSQTGGGLNAGQDYFIRALTPTLIAFYPTELDASNDTNRINLTAPITAQVRPYFTVQDLQRTIWDLVENNPGLTNGASPERVALILGQADAAVGIGRISVDYLPECDGVIGLLLQQYRIDQATGALIGESQVAVAVMPTTRIPDYCVDGSNCQTVELDVPRASVGDFVWRDRNNNGQQDDDDSGMPNVMVSLYSDEDELMTAPVFTDSTGHYEFSHVMPGAYYLTFTPPRGQVFTNFQAAGVDAAANSDADAAGRTPVFILVSGENNTAIDAGIRPIDLSLTKTVNDSTPAVDEFVYFETIVRNATGFSLATNVSVIDNFPEGQLDLLEASATKGTFDLSNIVWEIGDIEPGAMEVLTIKARVLVGGLIINDAEVYDADQPDLDSTPNNNPGIHEDDDDQVMLLPTSAIGDFVWRDMNSDGIQDEGEPGIAGFTVKLTGGDLMTPATTTTDGDGFYQFLNLNPGDYQLQFTPPIGQPGQVFTQQYAGGNSAIDSNVDSSGSTGLFTLGSGVNEKTIDAGVLPIDLSLEKIVSNPTPELGQNVTYTLTLSNAANGSNASNVSVVDTLPAGLELLDWDASLGGYGSGVWTVGTLVAGQTATLTLTVKVTSGGTFVNSAEVFSANPLDRDSTPGNGSTTEDDDATAILIVSSRIGDYVWRDMDLDGIQDAGEPGIAGFKVELFPQFSSVPTATTTTDAAGYYLFTGVDPATYQLKFTPPGSQPGQVFTQRYAGGNSEIDSNVDSSGYTEAFALGSGENQTTMDAGVKPVDLQLQKFVDWKVANGVEDPGEELFYVEDGKQFVFTIRVANAPNMSLATGVVVTDVIPTGMTYVDSSANYVASQGTFTSGIWSVGDLAGGASATLQVTVTADASGATPPPLGGTPNSIGSLFQGGDGDLVVAAGDQNLYYDWANQPPNLIVKSDKPDYDDDIFKTGSKEKDPVPTVEFSQSAPPKDNLLRFYTAHDQLGAKAFLYLAWVRGDTNGDANIDFELNQSSTISSNTVTPLRTPGDLLLSYEFSQGGGNPSISVMLWQAATGNQPAQWGTPTSLSASIAQAAVNTSSVLDLDGTTTLLPGQFGEAAINLTAAFQSINPSSCQNYASAFVKTRASTAFEAELKDFIAPATIQVSNCVTVRNVAEVTQPLIADYDSTPGNGETLIPEDDWDSLLVEIYPKAASGGQSARSSGSSSSFDQAFSLIANDPASAALEELLSTGLSTNRKSSRELEAEADLLFDDLNELDRPAWLI